MTDRRGIALVPVYIATHFNVEANYLPPGSSTRGGCARFLVLVAPCWMEVPWPPSFQHVGRCSSVVLHDKPLL